MSIESENSSANREKRASSILTHPLFIAVLSFIFTGVLATRYQNFLAETSKDREAALVRKQRTSEAVKSVTDLLFERVFRGSMVVSSLNRNAPLDELKERKKSYDDIYVHYNSAIQSNLFRIREIYNTTEYTDFEAMMEGGLRELLATQDVCVTVAYDDAISSDESRRSRIQDDLLHCRPAVNVVHPSIELPEPIAIDVVTRRLVHCEYVFSDALFRSVDANQNAKDLRPALITNVSKACQYGAKSPGPR